MDIGKKVLPPAKAPEPEWKPYPADNRFQVNSKGQLRTRVPMKKPDPLIDILIP